MIAQTIVLIVLSLLPPSVYAEEEYQMQISVSQSHFENDDDVEIDGHLIFVSHYFSPVHTSGYPLAEADFFERIGQIRLHAGPGELKDGSFDADRFSYGVSANFAKPRHPLTGQIFYSTRDTEYNFPIVGDSINERYGFDVGFFLADNFLIDFGHSRSKTKRSIIGLTNVEFKDQFYAINLKWVEKLPNNRAVNLQGSLVLNRFDDPTEDGENRIVAFAGDFYLNRRVSIGGGAVINRGDKETREGEVYFANVLAFLNPHFFIDFYYEDFSARNSGKDDTRGYRVSLGSRF